MCLVVSWSASFILHCEQSCKCLDTLSIHSPDYEVASLNYRIFHQTNDVKVGCRDFVCIGQTGHFSVPLIAGVVRPFAAQSHLHNPAIAINFSGIISVKSSSSSCVCVKERLTRNALHDYAQRGRLERRERRVNEKQWKWAYAIFRLSRLFSYIFNTRSFSSFDQHNICPLCILLHSHILVVVFGRSLVRNEHHAVHAYRTLR